MTPFQISQLKARQQLEKTWQRSPAERTATPVNAAPQPWLRKLGHWLVDNLTSSQQLRVWTKQTATGVQWHAYDPIRDRKAICNSEEEMRVWIETRHLHRS